MILYKDTLKTFNMEQQKDVNQNHNGHNGQRPQDAQLKPQQAYQGLAYIVRKSEKLTTALYLVTDIMSDKEPLKWKVREAGIELLSDITIASSAPASEKMTIFRNVMKKIERVIAFLDVAESARMLSSMNSSMLRKEYAALKDSVDAEWGRTHEQSKTIFSDRFFDVPHDAVLEIEEKKETIAPAVRSYQVTRNDTSMPTPTRTVAEPSAAVVKTEARRNTSQTSASHIEHGSSPAIKDTPNSVNRPQVFERPVATNQNTQNQNIQNTTRPFSPVVRPYVQGGTEQTTQVSHHSQPAQPNIHPERLSAVPMTSARPVIVDRDGELRTRPDVGRDDRRKIILALIKQMPSLTVGDVARSIQGVSEKTIQRELLSMVGEGILTKKGERRWSTYSLRAE